MTSQPKPKFYILFALVSFASTGAVIFPPALPSLAVYFNVSIPHSQLAVMFYLFGYALGELPYGPISNRFNRKIAIYIGAATAVVGSAICLLAGSVHLFPLFLFGLFITASGTAVGLGLTMAIIADCYQGNEQVKLTSHMFFSFAIMPAIAVVVGGFLAHYVNWQSCFYALGFYSLLILLLAIRLPYTEVIHDEKALKFTHLVDGYLTPLKNLNFVCCILIAGAVTTFVYFYAAQAPLIGITIIGLHPYQYGLLSLLPYIGMLAGAYFDNRIAAHLGGVGTIWLALILYIIAILVMLISFINGFVSIFTLFVPALILFFGVPLIYANIAAIGFSFLHDKSNASAVLNFFTVIISFIGVMVFSFSNIKSALVFPIALLVTAVLIALLMIRVKDQDVTKAQPHKIN